jgi:two-component system cell cycle response regulator
VSVGRVIRRAGAVASGALVAALACAMVAAGVLDGGSVGAGARGAPSLAVTVVAVAILAVAAMAVMRRLGWTAPSARAQRVSFWLRISDDIVDVEVALALLAAMFSVLALTGGQASPVYPMLYALVAFAATISAVSGAVVCVGGALLLELAMAARGPAGLGAASVQLDTGLHIAFILLAAIAHAVLLRGVATRWRRRRAAAVASELASLRRGARDYRLISSALGPSSRAAVARADEEEQLAIGGAELISDAAGWVLHTLQRSLGATTVALLWIDADRSDQLILKEIVSSRDDVREPGRLDAVGLLGAVVRDRAPIQVAVCKAGQLPYYAGTVAGQALCAVPVLDGAHLRGLLCADRPSAFEGTDRELLQSAGAQLLRTVQAEQVFRAVERAKYEHERFFLATAMLGRALTPEQVMDTAFDGAAAIAEYDAAVITRFDRDAGVHRVSGVRVRPGGEGLIDPAALEELTFKDNAGLVAMVVKNRHYLPAGGELRDAAAHVFTKKIKLDGARSLLVLPLLAADEPVGTLTLISRVEKRFGSEVREMLSVIATQVAVSLENGLLYRRMETMATTDGLTGLTNHRTFQEKFSEVLERAQRHGHKASILLCDVDHFKKVNDTYGHPVGDEVLRRVARVLQDVARKIDITARYGGEEFVVILDHADIEQARAVAERIRIEVGKLVVESDKGPFKVTQSIGVAAFPADGETKAALIEHADHALYHAKRSGRNRVVTYPEFQRARASGAVDAAAAANDDRKAS